MRINKKFKYLISLGLISLIGLSSCSLLFNETNDLSSSYTCIDYSFTKEELNSIHKSMNKLDNFVADDSTVYRNSFIINANNVYIGLLYMRRYYTIEYVSYCMKGYSENQEKYLMYYNEFNDGVKWLNNFKQKVYTSNYKSIFYEDMTDEEIEEILDNSSYSDEYYRLNSAKASLEAKYETLSDEQKIQQGSQYIYDLVNLNKNIGIEVDEDYRSYSYENEYNRTYDYNLTLEYANNIREYVFDYAKKLSSDFSASYNEAKKEDSLSYQVFNKLESYATSESLQYVKDYVTCASLEDNKFINAYNGLKENENYFVGNYDNSYQGAYTTTLLGIKIINNELVLDENYPIMYFGSKYYDASTVVHEFGHFYHFLNNGNMPSYDLAETQSQGNEALFWRYLLDKSDLKDDALLYNEYNILKSFRTIILCSIVNTFEIKAYERENFSVEDVDVLIDEVLNDYYLGYDSIFDDTEFDFDRYDKNGNLTKSASEYIKSYIKRVTITSHLYYISYSTSLFAALNIYNVAKDNFEDAKAKYMLLSDESGDLIDACGKVGFTSPFDEETFKNICNIEEN